MTALAATLAALMGASLGLLGGGGSILAVPLLLYVVGVEPREAIATSLLVVGATSAFCAIQHYRAGFVRWRTAVTFGGFAVAGAYLGGWLAQFFSGAVLLALFALMMVPAGIAMIRGHSELAPLAPGRRAIWKAAAEGLVVGAITGLVGAGGGFLVVPALVLLGGLRMREAIGTSTLVIALKSFAGFAGHAAHVSVDLGVAAGIVGFAVLGSVVGTRLVKRVDPVRLRAGFGVLVLLMAAFIGIQQLPATGLERVLSEPWPFWVGGLAIGLFVLAFLAVTGKPLGVSTGLEDVCSAPFDSSARRSWRLPFLVGIVGGGLLASLASGGMAPTTDMGSLDLLASTPFPLKAGIFALGGVLIGFGTRTAGGCTSGHGIVGMSILARSSLAATAIFMGTGFVVTQLLFFTFGG